MEYFKKLSVTDSITQSEDLCGTKMYLVEGSERAVLIDTGIGLGNIYRFVCSITDKPLDVIITHGHVDHAMGSGTFAKNVSLYMNQADFAIYKQHSEKKFRFQYFDSVKLMFAGIKFLFKKTADLEWYDPADVDRFKPLKAGDVFELGNEKLEICSGAGHTAGCITVLFKNARILLTGDAANNGTYLFDTYSLPVSAYKKAMIELKKQSEGKYDKVLVCHGMPKKIGFADKNMVNGAIWLCDAILDNRDLRIKTKRMEKACYTAKKFMSKKDIGDKSDCNIIYSDYTLR